MLIGMLQVNANPSSCMFNEFSIYKPIRIHIDFLIASPRSGCESEIGICRGSIGGGKTSEENRSVEAECYIEDNVLVMMIKRGKMGYDLQKELENINYFPMNDEFDVPRDWLDEMKIADSFAIPIGEYKIKDLSDYFLINFTIR